jgi:signal peptidase II
MILGGATGNLIDRVLRGEVVDFLDVYVSRGAFADWLLDRFGTTHWPTFNIADSAIVCGAGLLLLDVIRPESRKTPQADRR